MRSWMALSWALVWGCGDKDGGDDTAASDDTAAESDTDAGGDTDTDTDTDELGELGAAPESGEIVARYTVGGESDTMVCTGGRYGQVTADTFIFNSLNHGDVCTTGGSSFVALNNIPRVSATTWPGGIADVQVEVNGVANRVYGADITGFRVDVQDFNEDDRHLVATVQARWADAQLEVWIDADFN